MQSNMSAGQVAVFQPGMAQVRANVSAMPAPNSQTLQNMQLQFHQQMNAVLQQQQQQQQQQQHLHLQQPQNLQHTGQLATQIAQAGAAPWTIQTSSAQHSAYQVPTAADAQLRRIGPGGSLSGQVAAAAAPAVTQAVSADASWREREGCLTRCALAGPVSRLSCSAGISGWKSDQPRWTGRTMIWLRL